MNRMTALEHLKEALHHIIQARFNLPGLGIIKHQIKMKIMEIEENNKK